jgi:RNA polymerase sigma-70 factor (ECF subfamily)
MRLDDAPASKEHLLEQTRELDRFLSSVEKRAFRIARIVVRNDDDALDIVQDAMLQLARSYSERPADEWRPLFYRILQNRIRDFQRRGKVRAKILSWLPGRGGESEAAGDPLESVPDTGPLPLDQLSNEHAMRVIERAIAELPQRQQEAFLLRNFEGLNVAETASAMGCTEGSVKTHYSRAVHGLRAQLEASGIVACE